MFMLLKDCLEVWFWSTICFLPLQYPAPTQGLLPQWQKGNCAYPGFVSAGVLLAVLGGNLLHCSQPAVGTLKEMAQLQKSFDSPPYSTSQGRRVGQAFVSCLCIEKFICHSTKHY